MIDKSSGNVLLLARLHFNRTYLLVFKLEKKNDMITLVQVKLQVEIFLKSRFQILFQFTYILSTVFT